MTKIYSHPGVLLVDHLRMVGESIKSRIRESPINLMGLPKEFWIDFGYIIGIFHDFGKFTPFFQNHLVNKKNKKNTDPKSHHAAFSAFFSLYLLKDYFISFEKKTEIKIPDELKLVFFLVIRKHHSKLTNFKDEINFNENISEFKLFKDQADSILNGTEILNQISTFYWNQFTTDVLHFPLLESVQNSNNLLTEQLFYEELKNFLFTIQQDTTLTLVKAEFNLLKKIYDNFKYEMSSTKPSNSILSHLFFVTQYFFSILIDSDKINASKFDENLIRRKEIPFSIIELFRRYKFKNSLQDSMNIFREKFYQEVVQFSKTTDISSNHIFTITAPTGIGKTIAAFAFALKIRERIIQNQNFREPPRILYFLPFTSIIDQNYTVIEEIFSFLKDFNHDSSFLLKHHHLTEIEYKAKGVEISNDQALLLIESWNAEVVLSTFYQFFYTIFGYSNANLKKYHKLTNSIIVLDEIQSLPLLYHSVLRECLLFLVNHFGTNVLLLTATQPKIFAQEDVVNVLSNPQNYFEDKLINRINFSFDLQHQFINNIVSKEKYFPPLITESLILVTNTIKSSINFTKKILGKYQTISIADLENLKEIRECLDFQGKMNLLEAQINKIENLKPILFYLSTNIAPITRKLRINIINKLEKHVFILITTQLIEAGVDIDAKHIIRDFGPMDSLIQVSGRCNRNQKNKSLGEVKIVHLIDEENKNRPYCDYIYDPVFIDKTQRMLELYDKKQPLQENLFLKIGQGYFDSLHDYNLQSKENLLKILLNCDFSPKNKKDKSPKINYLQDFILIKKSKQTQEIFLPLNAEAVDYKKAYQEAISKYAKLRSEKEVPLQELFQAKTQIKNISRQLQNYIISVPLTKLDKNNISDDYDIFFAPHEWMNQYYDPLVGFSLEDPFLKEE